MRYAWVAFLTLSAGCVGALKSDYPERRFYTLSAERPGEAAAPGKDGVLRVRRFTASKLSEGSELVTRTGDVVSPAIPASEPLKNQCQHFLRSVLTRQPVLSDGNDGLRVVEVVVAINQSIARRGVPIMLRSALADAA